MCAMTETQEPGPGLDSEETSKEARAAAPEAWAGPGEEPPQAPEPPRGQGSPTEDLMFMAAPEQAVLAAPLEPAAASATAADAPAAEAIETDTATAHTAVATPVSPAAASLIDLWPGNGEEASTAQAEPRVPTPPSGAEVTLAEVPLLDEVAEEPLPLAGKGCANLLNFDELPEPPATFCDPEEELEGEPLAAPQVPTLPSALEELDQEPEPEPHLLTNGETTQKEGTQVGQGQPGGRGGGQGSSRGVPPFSVTHVIGGSFRSSSLGQLCFFCPRQVYVSLETTDGITGCWGNELRPGRSALVILGGAQ